MSENLLPAPQVKGNIVIDAPDSSRECAVIADWFIPLKDATHESLALLLGLLSESPKAFYDRRSLLLKELSMGDASISWGLTRRDGYWVVSLVSSCPINRYMRSVVPVESTLVRTISNLFQRGVRTDDLSLNLAKGKLLRANADSEGNPASRAVSRLSAMLPDSSILPSPGGNSDVLRSLGAEQVEKALAALKAAPSALACHNLPKGALKALTKAFGKESYPRLECHPTECNTEGSAPSVYEAEDLKSEVVLRSYRLGSEFASRSLDDWALRGVLSIALTGGNSILFRGLREEKGLTYSVSGSFGAGPDVLTISFKTGERTGRRALGELDNLMSSASEKLDEEIFSAAVAEYLFDVKDLVNSFSASLCSRQILNLVSGVSPAPQDWLDAVNRVDIERVRAALGSLEPLCGVMVVRKEDR